uniref:Uncharacterized protein n=1 Tax=Triticum urartu TaxID=4572 RepID=A0A8R7K2L1_TRIUA
MRELHGGFTEGDGVDGEEEETEAGVLAALGWFQDREGKDFMPLEGKEQRIREKKQPEEPENTAPVLYISHIPHASMSTRCKVSQ